MECPYCMTPFTPDEDNGNGVPQCGECGREISGIFIKAMKRSVPWFTMGMVGFSNHGKTVYITSLFYLLCEVMMNRSFWSNFTVLNMDKETMKFVMEGVELLKKGQLPDATAAAFPQPSLVQLSNLPVSDEVYVSMYDIGGEVYQDMDTITERASLIARSHTLLFMISIDEDVQNWKDKIYGLLTNYIVGVADHLHLKPVEYQHLVVVFTKADEVVHTLPPALQTSVIEGGCQAYRAVNRVTLDRVRADSLLIQQWLRDNGAGGFLNLGQQRFKSVHYCMVSSLGQKPFGNRLPAPITPEDPKNVLAPFLLALGNHIEFPQVAVVPGQEVKGEDKSKSLWERVRNLFSGAQAG